MEQEITLFGCNIRKGGSILFQLEFLNAFYVPMLTVEDKVEEADFSQLYYVSTKTYDVAFQTSVVHSLYEVLSKSPRNWNAARKPLVVQFAPLGIASCTICEPFCHKAFCCDYLLRRGWKRMEVSVRG